MPLILTCHILSYLVNTKVIPATLIDNIFSNAISKDNICVNTTATISDHQPNSSSNQTLLLIHPPEKELVKMKIYLGPLSYRLIQSFKSE